MVRIVRNMLKRIPPVRRAYERLVRTGVARAAMRRKLQIAADVSDRVNPQLSSTAIKERDLLRRAREIHESEYDGAVSDSPLVSILIATWNRADVLTERTLPSVLQQDYPNCEVVIVGDCCTDQTEEKIQRIGDARIRFENLPSRGPYPRDRTALHMVGGTYPMNRAEKLARGLWCAHLDDDECWTQNHITSLLSFAESRRLEFVWGRCAYEIGVGIWRVEGSAEPELYDMPHSTLLYRSYLSCIPYDLDAWRLGLGGDRHRLRRFRLAGARGGFLNEVVTVSPLRPGTTRPWADAEDRE